MERTQARLFNGGDVNKNVLAPAAGRLNKPIPFGRVEPLHCALGHTQNPMLLEQITAFFFLRYPKLVRQVGISH